MSGALFLLFVVLAAIVVVVFSLSPLLFIPIAIMVLVGLVVGPLGELRHGQVTIGSLGQEQEDLVVASGEAVLRDEIRFQDACDRRVAQEVAAPRLQRRALETGSNLRAHAYSLLDCASAPGSIPEQALLGEGEQA